MKTRDDIEDDDGDATSHVTVIIPRSPPSAGRRSGRTLEQLGGRLTPFACHRVTSHPTPKDPEGACRAADSIQRRGKEKDTDSATPSPPTARARQLMLPCTPSPARTERDDQKKRLMTRRREQCRL